MGTTCSIDRCAGFVASDTGVETRTEGGSTTLMGAADGARWCVEAVSHTGTEAAAA
jgi:hypothetical protein